MQGAGERTQRRRNRKQRSTRRSIIVLCVLAAILAIGGWHYWTLYRTLTGARDDLEAAQDRLEDAGLNVKAADLAAARTRFRSAGDNLTTARRHFRWDPLVQASRIVPGVDTQVSAVSDFLDMGVMLVEAGLVATGAGDKVVAFRDAPHGSDPLTKSLVTLLDQVDPEVERLDGLADELVRRRRAMGDEPLFGPLARMRDRIDRDLPKLANTVEQARQTKALLPGFLGVDRDRKYLLYALNSGELLPGGGLVTAAGIMPVSGGVNGQIDFTDSTSWLTAWLAKGGSYIEPPGPLKRYLLRDYSWNLLVSNWDPDFPTWAQQSRQFYELIHGEQKVDAIIAVDLTVLSRLLRVTGPKTIDVAGAGRVTFDEGNAILTLESLTRQAFDPGGDRKSVIGDLAEQVMADLLHLPSDRWATAVDIVRDLGAERHIQVLSFDPAEQTIIRDFGWDGRINRTSRDYLQFNESSVASTKLNLIVKPVGTYTIALNGLGDARHELNLRYANPLPEWSKGKDPQLVKNLMLDGLYGGYLRVLGPENLTSPAVFVDGQPGAVEDVGMHAGREWFGTLLTLPPGATRDVTMRWTVPIATTNPDEYAVYLQKQAGTDGLCLGFNLTREGQRPRSIVVSGGTRDAQDRICLTTDVTITASF